MRVDSKILLTISMSKKARDYKAEKERLWVPRPDNGVERLTIGIDPGVGGAYCCLKESGHLLSVEKWTSREAFKDFVERMRSNFSDDIFVWIESVHAMPRQGVSTTWTFAQNYGEYLGLIEGMGLPSKKVLPQHWQALYWFPVMEKQWEHKKNLRLRAKLMFPGFKWTNATADAALIAQYGVYKHTKVKHFNEIPGLYKVVKDEAKKSRLNYTDITDNLEDED